MLEVADRTSGPRATDVLSLTNISWADDADEAAGDLSLVDARFDKSVLEVAVATFLEEWAMNDGSLDFTAVRTPNRTVMRTATVRGIEVRELVSREPIAFRVAVDAHGIYYEVDRRTEEVVAGDPRASRTVPFSSRCAWMTPPREDGQSPRSNAPAEPTRSSASPARRGRALVVTRWPYVAMAHCRPGASDGLVAVGGRCPSRG